MKWIIIVFCYIFKFVFSQSLSCSNIKPINNINIPQLQGGWIALESMSFPRGPNDKINTDTRAAWRSRVCIHTEFLNASLNGLTMLSELHLPEEEDIEIARNHFSIDKNDPGRWKILSNYPNLQGSEMLVIKSEPLSYIVLVLCLPPPPPDDQEDWIPDVNGERYVSTVSLLSRRQDREHHIHLSSKQRELIKNHIKNILGLQKFKTQNYDTNC